MERSQRDGNLEKAAELTYSILPSLINELDIAKKAFENNDTVGQQVESRHSSHNKPMDRNSCFKNARRRRRKLLKMEKQMERHSWTR